VNNRNIHYRSAGNPHFICEVPVHDVKIRVQCVITHRIIGTVFFQGIVNSKWYVRLILTLFFCELKEEEKA
jgi:hypothetical protein